MLAVPARRKRRRLSSQEWKPLTAVASAPAWIGRRDGVDALYLTLAHGRSETRTLVTRVESRSDRGEAAKATAPGN
jgi:hypothetical protein